MNCNWVDGDPITFMFLKAITDPNKRVRMHVYSF